MIAVEKAFALMKMFVFVSHLTMHLQIVLCVSKSSVRVYLYLQIVDSVDIFVFYHFALFTPTRNQNLMGCFWWYQNIETCPSGTAWMGKAYAFNMAHKSAECSNQGICDRSSVSFISTIRTILLRMLPLYILFVSFVRYDREVVGVSVASKA